MGLKFESSDDLDKLFDSFAVDPKENKREENEQKNKQDETDKQD